MISFFEKYNKLSWIITILIAIIIFYVSSLTFEPIRPFGFDWKPIAYHFYAFLFLAAFLLISLIRGKVDKNYKKLLTLAIIIAILYAISDEIHQIFVPSRAFAISDILTDSAGILFASLLYSLLRFDNSKTSEVNKEVKDIKKAVLE